MGPECDFWGEFSYSGTIETLVWKIVSKKGTENLWWVFGPQRPTPVSQLGPQREGGQQTTAATFPCVSFPFPRLRFSCSLAFYNFFLPPCPPAPRYRVPHQILVAWHHPSTRTRSVYSRTVQRTIILCVCFIALGLLCLLGFLFSGVLKSWGLIIFGQFLWKAQKLPLNSAKDGKYKG